MEALLPQLAIGQVLIGVALGFFLARQFPKVLPSLSLGSILGGGDETRAKLDELNKKIDDLLNKK